MGCCGQKRVALRKEYNQPIVRQKNHREKSLPNHRENVPFKYLGTSLTTIKGTITSKRYIVRFFGAIVNIDHRDVPGIMAEPNMERVKEK